MYCDIIPYISYVTLSHTTILCCVRFQIKFSLTMKVCLLTIMLYYFCYYYYFSVHKTHKMKIISS